MPSPKKSRNGKVTTPKSARNASRKGGKRKLAEVTDDESVVEADDNESDDASAYEEPASDEDDAVSLHSDALDDDDFDVPSSFRKKNAKSPSKKQKRDTKQSSPSKKATSSSPKKASPKKTRTKKDADEDDEEFDDGLEIVGTVVQAPTTGQVPPGRISRNTLNFLRQLMDPACNDREWFKLHEPVYRQAEKEWKDFVEHFTPLLIEADPEIPVLPPNDVIHRIYRDVRFSNDKTPYKTNLSASFSRGGRKGIFAGYHVSINPGQTLFAAGTWCPGKNELQTIRNNILHDSSRLREVLSTPDFVHFFGEPKRRDDGERQSIFGRDDELKVAPKGVDKNHKDIDLLKCRSFAVAHRFMDSEVLDPNFEQTLKRIAKVVQPFVHCLNDLMTLQPTEGSDED